MALHRRRLLALLAAGGGTVAGCRDIASRPGSPTDGTPTHATPRPKPASEVGCPSYDRREPERVVCSQDPPEDSLVLEPVPETAEFRTATVDCRLTNSLDGPLATNYFDWTLHRYRDGAWHYLGPYAVPMPLHRLPPGDTHVRRLVGTTPTSNGCVRRRRRRRPGRETSFERRVVTASAPAPPPSASGATPNGRERSTRGVLLEGRARRRVNQSDAARRHVNPGDAVRPWALQARDPPERTGDVVLAGRDTLSDRIYGIR